MTKAELVEAMADKAGLNKAQAKGALDAFISSVSTSLKAGKEVRLVGFGSLSETGFRRPQPNPVANLDVVKPRSLEERGN